MAAGEKGTNSIVPRRHTRSFLSCIFRVGVFARRSWQRPEAAERRRVEAAAELQRQKEQEEWDRAFEEELVQTGLPEDVVAACVYQVLAVRLSCRSLGCGWSVRCLVRADAV